MMRSAELHALICAHALQQGQRFWSKIACLKDTTVCWLWTKFRERDGYGRFSVQVPGSRHGYNMPAHRVAFLLANGSLARDLEVLHECDNPPCCNPAHLRQGTQQENIRDCVARGRYVVNGPRGEKHRDARLTEAQVLEIRAEYAAPGSRYGRRGLLSKRYGVAKQTIDAVVTRRTWSHLPAKKVG